MSIPYVGLGTSKLIARMTSLQRDHARWAAEPMDLSQVDELALGDLWATAHAADRWEDHRPVQSIAADTARAVLTLRHKLEPVFRGSACRDYLELLARRAEEEPAKVTGLGSSWHWHHACFVLNRCIELSYDGLPSAARRFLTAMPEWRVAPHIALALARLVDSSFTATALERLVAELADDPLLADELRIAAELDLPSAITLASVAHPDPGRAELAEGEPDHRLSAMLLYAEFAEAALSQAAERVRAIHALTLPYFADKAFTLRESSVIARAARVALDRDEAWLPPMLDELFLKVSVAPTAAKTMPSQSVAIALGHAIEAFPTPETVTSLRNVLRTLRHAGVEKKLQRNLRGAERGLAGRPEIALRMPLDLPITKPQLTTLARCLEAGFGTSLTLGYEEWSARLASHPFAKSLAGSLIWRVESAPGDSIVILPVTGRGGLQLHDVVGRPVTTAPDGRVSLWHPLSATADERSAWRDRVVALQLKQPFKQVFREHYVLSIDEGAQQETEMFAGHVVSIRPLLGLARREGWQVEHDCGLARTTGRWTISFGLAHSIYPGATGWTTTGKIRVWAGHGRRAQRARLCDMPMPALSEILRSVDLLVSTSGFAIASSTDGSPDDPHRLRHLERLAEKPLGPMAEMRKHALERALRNRDEGDQFVFDARHLRVGAYAIHLTTGRVTRDGEPVVVDLPEQSKLAAVPWLPYDERLLETIAYTAFELARRGT